jgi:plastocyanin
VRRRCLPFIALFAFTALAACSAGSPSGAPPSTPASPPSVPASPPVASASAPAGSPAAAACAETTDAATVEVRMAGRAFSPATATAKVGDVVGWTNNDSAPHNAIFGAGCRTATLEQGDSASLVFTAPGTYGYACGIHPDMTATIEVSE